MTTTAITRVAEEDMENVFLEASRAFGIPFRSAFRSRHRQAVRARAAAMVWARNQMDLTVEQIGSFFGMDHSTVVYHCQQHDHRLKHESQYRASWTHMASHLQ